MLLIGISRKFLSPLEFVVKTVTEAPLRASDLHKAGIDFTGPPYTLAGS